MFALGTAKQWEALEKFSKEKKPPIGTTSCVQVSSDYSMIIDQQIKVLKETTTNAYNFSCQLLTVNPGHKYLSLACDLSFSHLTLQGHSSGEVESRNQCLPCLDGGP